MFKYLFVLFSTPNVRKDICHLLFSCKIFARILFAPNIKPSMHFPSSIKVWFWPWIPLRYNDQWYFTMSQVSPLLETSSYSKLFKCQDSGEGEEGEVPRPSQSNTQSDECCVIYQELPLDNITQTVTAEINLHADSSAPSPPPTVLMSVSAAGLPDDVESADICQHPESPAAPRRTSSIVKRLQSAISGI